MTVAMRRLGLKMGLVPGYRSASRCPCGRCRCRCLTALPSHLDLEELGALRVQAWEAWIGGFQRTSSLSSHVRGGGVMGFRRVPPFFPRCPGLGVGGTGEGGGG